MFYFKNNQKGSFLIEAVVSVSLVTVGLLGIIALVTKSISLNNNVHGRFIAAGLAAEGIEVVKNIIDTNIVQGRNWNAGLDNGDYEVVYNSNSLSTNGDRFLRFATTTGFYNYNLNNTVQTPFKRKVQIRNSNDGKSIQVNSIVTWTVKGITSEINVEDHFYNWRK